MIVSRGVFIVAAMSALTGCGTPTTDWQPYAGPAESLTRIDVQNRGHSILLPATFVDGEGCHGGGFGNLNGEENKPVWLIEPGQMVQFNVEKGKLFTISLRFQSGSLNFSSECQMTYSFVPTSDRYVLSAQQGAKGQTCSTGARSSSGAEVVAVRRTRVPGELFTSSYCVPMSNDERLRLGLARQ